MAESEGKRPTDWLVLPEGWRRVGDGVIVRDLGSDAPIACSWPGGGLSAGVIGDLAQRVQLEMACFGFKGFNHPLFVYTLDERGALRSASFNADRSLSGGSCEVSVYPGSGGVASIARFPLGS